MSGYNISCDPGDLYSRRCYVTNPSSGAKEEIIGYDSAGNPLSKGATSAAGTAWQINYTVLNQDGNAYQPYGAGGLPWTMSGLAGIFGIMPSGGADPQDWNYITNVAPGSFSRKMYNSRVCNPLWPTFGCRTTDPASSNTVTTSPTEETQPGSESWYQKFFGAENSDSAKYQIQPTTFIFGGLALISIVWLLRKLLGDSVEDDKSEISNKVEAQKEAEKNVARKAWRATMLGAVGSLAFFLSTLGNLSRTAKTHGNPVKHLEKHDIALFSVPILVISYFVIESLKNGEETTDAS